MDKIYYGGRIVTMEKEGDYPEAVLVKDGRIAGVGEIDALRAAAGCDVQEVNLEGKCLMPSFIDPHSHIVMNGQMALLADLSECESFDDIVAALNAYVEKNSQFQLPVVIGFGYDHNFLAEGRHPDKFVLDRVTSTIPVLAQHQSGHMAVVNSAMLRLMGVDENTPDPSGGVFGRVEGSSEPNGYLEEGALMLLQSQLMGGGSGGPDPSVMINAMQKVYIENGVTTAQDGATSPEYMQILKLANATGQLKLDVVAYPIMGEAGRTIMEENKDLVKKYDGRLKIGGYKMILDGSPQGRSAWMSEPYEGSDDYCGYPWMPEEEADAFALEAVNDNLQLLTHCNGDAASEQFLNSYTRALAKSENPDKDNLRPVMIHCQTVRNDQLDRMADINMIASVFVGHVYYWGDIHVKNFGEKRGNHVSPARDALDRGITVNFHQDTPVTKTKMLHSVWTAVNRISRGGNVIGEDQKVSVYEALQAVTINGAYQYFEEDEKGSIKEGKRADLVILDRNPLDVDPMEIKDIKVLETIKDGESIYVAC